MQTFVILKPDAIHRGIVGKIISRFEDAGFEIFAIRRLQKGPTWFDAMYPHLTGTVQCDMRNFMLSRPLIGIILDGSDAVVRIRKIVGCTDSFRATLGTIRGDYGRRPIRFNCVHASDTPEAVTKEIRLFFGDDNG